MARYTTDQVISQFKKTHGDKFDYSKVEYLHAQTKVKIICRIHGEFEQLVGMHRKGQGCAKCMHDGKRHSKEQVIIKFIKTHGNRYCYSQMKYINTDTKINIICHKHGVFKQTPDKHITGNGCPKCIGRHKTLEDVLLEFENIHGKKYIYSKVNFLMITKKVEIICPEHGIFLQTPQNHILGKGCAKCASVVLLTQDEILKLFTAAHGARYDYTQVNYVGGKSRVKIYCKEHGIFEQLPYLHKNGSGCPKCAGVVTHSITEVLDQFYEVHGGRYDYSKVKYTGVFSRIIIICCEHGEFIQTPKSHKKGSGCPDCAITIGYTKESYLSYCNTFNGKTHLYLIKCEGENEEFFKVGISRLGALVRFDSKAKLPYNFKVLEQVYGDASLIWDLEKSIHKLLAKQKYKPNLEFHGKTECFKQIPNSIYKLLKKFNNDQQLQFIA